MLLKLAQVTKKLLFNSKFEDMGINLEQEIENIQNLKHKYIIPRRSRWKLRKRHRYTIFRQPKCFRRF